MKRTLNLIMTLALTLTTWSLQAAINPDIVEVDLDIDYLATDDPAEWTPGGFVCVEGRRKITLQKVQPADWGTTAGDSTKRVRLSWGSTNIAIYTAATGGDEVISGTDYENANLPTNFWVEGVSVSATAGTSSEPGPETILAQAIPDGMYDRVAFTIVKMGLVPNYDRDDDIDSDDVAISATEKNFTFWINDDKDEEDDYSGASGIPGQTSGNHSDSVVNGHGDLIDFFPVWLDLHDMLSLLPPGGDVQYKLAQADNALKAVYSALTRDQANSFLTVSNTVYGPAFDTDAYLAPTFQISASGVVLSTNFLQRIKDDPDRGILLLEGAAETTSPLVLEIWKGTAKIVETRLLLVISGVEAMYRWHNFRNSPSIAERLGNPTNRPDSVCKNVDVLLAHGFLVPENEARAWGAEFFKRLYQEGMNARFHAVTWSGDTGASISYEENVNNIFLTASNYAARVNAIKATNNSEVVALAHSLGCMFTSAALVDGGMLADKFFALNGAVAAEAFDAGMADMRTNSLNRLLHPDWRGYKARTWASIWHRLFTNSAAFSGDDRVALTWRGRLAPASAVLYNFWSSGDEVLEIAQNDDIDVFSGLEWDWSFDWWPVSVNARRYVWHKQALFKGRSGLYGTIWAGWGFWEYWLGGKVYSMAEANELNDDTLRADPVFRHNPDEMFSSNIVKSVQNNILARGIPELSFPIGSTNLTLTHCEENIDMNTALRREDGAWPQRDVDFSDDGQRPIRWLHTDLFSLPHYYTHELYKRLALDGGMK